MKHHLPGTFHPPLFFLLTLFAILLAGLWPFDFWPGNQVFWLEGENGILFNGQGIVFGEWSGAKDLSSVTIEVVLTPKDKPDHHLSRILALTNPNRDEIFSLSQWRSTLEIRTGVGPRIKRAWVKDILTWDKVRVVSIGMGAAGTDVFVDGALAKSFPNMAVPGVDGSPIRWTLLGNSPTGKDPWKGEISGLAFFPRAIGETEAAEHYRYWAGFLDLGRLRKDGLSSLYLFNQGTGSEASNLLSPAHPLLIPSVFRPLRFAILESKVWFKRSFVKDTILNLLGFVPLGLSLFLVLSRIWGSGSLAIFSASILVGGGISLAIEVLQGWLPTRTSSLFDLVLNTLGTAVGAFLARRYLTGV